MSIEVWAHRGASGYVVENTLEAFKLAIEQNSDGVELDVQLSKDGELVVIHDENLKRLTGYNINAKDLTLEEIKKMNIIDVFNKNKEKKYMIPTLYEVYELLKDTTLKINVELKTSIFEYKGIEEKVYNLTKDMGLLSRVIFSSFNHHSLKRLKKIDETIELGLLVSDVLQDVGEYAQKIGVHAIHPHKYQLFMYDVLEEIQNSYLKINIWTIDEEKEILEVSKLGVNSIITNYPDRVKKVLGLK